MRILLLLIVIALASCKSDTNNNTSIESTKTEKTITKSNTKNIASENKSLGTKESLANSKPSLGSETRSSESKGAKTITNYNSNGIPDACDLLTEKTIAKYLKIPAKSINLSDGSSSKNNLQRACFFKWDGSDIKNAGVMVQVQQNPVADDVPDYLTYMVESLKTQGENDMNGGSTKFKNWEGFGDDGAYSTTVGKYVWRIGNEWAFMVAFNTNLKPKQQKRAAEAFAKEVMERMSL